MNYKYASILRYYDYTVSYLTNFPQETVSDVSNDIRMFSVCIQHLSSSRLNCRITVDLFRRSWVRFPPRSKDFFFASCGFLFPFTRANAQWVIHGFK